MTSCETEFADTYIIKNNSSRNLVIFAYDRMIDSQYSVNTYDERIEIDAGSNYSVQKARGFQGEDPTVFETSEIDSIFITFDHVRFLSFACDKPLGNLCSGKYNLMNIEENWTQNKSGKSSGKQEYTYTYEFNEVDYENAELIE